MHCDVRQGEADKAAGRRAPVVVLLSLGIFSLPSFKANIRKRKLMASHFYLFAFVAYSPSGASNIEKLVYIIYVFCGTKLIDDESKLSRLGGAGCGKVVRYFQISCLQCVFSVHRRRCDVCSLYSFVIFVFFFKSPMTLISKNASLMCVDIDISATTMRLLPKGRLG